MGVLKGYAAKYHSPAKEYSDKFKMNIPLPKEAVEILPVGFTVTGPFPNRAARRRMMFQTAPTNNRKRINKRGVKSRAVFMQIINLLDGIKKIFHLKTT